MIDINEIDRIRERHRQDEEGRGMNHGHGYTAAHVDRYALLCFLEHLHMENQMLRERLNVATRAGKP